VFINDDGETSRDFCYIDNCVQANLLAATVDNDDALNQVYNVAVAQQTTLNQLFEQIKANVHGKRPTAADSKPVYRDFRPGDVRHSLADIEKAKKLLHYAPTDTIVTGLEKTAEWYFKHS
jgi:UDP-N-acetylglucosamine 4-epimerase